VSEYQTVITNAGPLMALGKLNRLELLATLYSTVQMPTAVYNEVVQQGLARGEPDARIVRHFWQHLKWPIIIVSLPQIAALTLLSQLGHGERAVLALALVKPRPLVLMDDAAARSEARRLGIPARGTLGILVQAYRQQQLALNEVEFLIEELAERPDIWISQALCQQVLDELRREATGSR
jgi:uncharacterized protein